MNDKGEAIFDSDKGVLSDKGLSDGIVSESKIVDNSIGSTKLNVEELFVSENAFMNRLKAVEIDAANITTGKISSERLDIQGLVSFDAFDESIKDVFDVRGNKTYINGGMIAANSIKADKIDLLSGITVKGPDGTNTFAISTNGAVEVNGLLHSGNFNEEKNLGYKISPDGTAILNQATIRGDVKLPNAGITNYGATIGNENMLRNSNFRSGLNHWRVDNIDSAGTNKSIMVETGGDYIPPNIYALQIRGTNTNERYGVQQDFTLKPNTKYTLTGYCSCHRANNLRITFRNREQNGAHIHNFVPANSSGGTDFSKWTRIKTTFTTQSASNYTMNLYTEGMRDNGYAWFAELKLEEGEKETPWCPHKDEQINFTRFWAGTSFENRDSAPFRVYQNGDVFAANGTFTGLLKGTLDSGDVQIYNNAFTIHAPKTETEVIRMEAGQCSLNTDVSFGNNNVNYTKGNNLLSLSGTDFTVQSSQGTLYVNKDNGATGGVNILGPSGGHHVFRGSTLSDKQGTLVFDSEGNQGAVGDFSFTRKNYTEKCKVDIDGELSINEKISSQKQGIELRSVKNSSWEGWGFYAM